MDISNRTLFFSICKTKKKYQTSREYWSKIFNRVDNPKLLPNKNDRVYINYSSSALYKGSQHKEITGHEFLCTPFYKASIKALKNFWEKIGP